MWLPFFLVLYCLTRSKILRKHFLVMSFFFTHKANFTCNLGFQHFGITTHQNGESHNTLNWETIQPYQMHVFWVFSHSFLPKHKITWKTSFMWEKNDITRKVSFWVFLSVLSNKVLKSRAITLHWKKKKHFLPVICF